MAEKEAAILGAFEEGLVRAAVAVAVGAIAALAIVSHSDGLVAAARSAAAALPAIATLIATIAIIRLTARYVRLTDKIANATEILALLEDEEGERRRSKFLVTNEWTELRLDPNRDLPVRVPFGFSVRNAGGQDAAIEDVFVEFPRHNGGRYRQRVVNLKRIPRVNEDESDWLIRAGDRVHFSAKVAAPHDFNGIAPLIVVLVTGEESRAELTFLDEDEAAHEREREIEDALGL